MTDAELCYLTVRPMENIFALGLGHAMSKSTPSGKPEILAAVHRFYKAGSIIAQHIAARRPAFESRRILDNANDQNGRSASHREAECAQDGDEKARLLQLGMAYAISQTLYVAAKLGLADVLARGPPSVAELARATEVDAAALGGVVRVLESLGLFTKVPHSESWTITSAGRYLRGDVDGSLKAIMALLGRRSTRHSATCCTR